MIIRKNISLGGYGADGKPMTSAESEDEIIFDDSECRFLAACFAMAGLNMNPNPPDSSTTARLAVRDADALLAELSRPTDAASAGEVKEESK